MSEAEIKKTFGRLLMYYLRQNEKRPADLVKDLGIPFSTVSNWCTGQKMPRMGNVELLADYLHINKSDLLEDRTNEPTNDTQCLSREVKIKTLPIISVKDKAIDIKALSEEKEKILKRLEEINSLLNCN